MSIIVIIFILIIAYLLYQLSLSKPKFTFTDIHKHLLNKHVLFYQKLSETQKVEFERRLTEFLNDCYITGVKTEVEDIDKVLIGASAIIPIFHFHTWKYPHLKEILLYPNAFNFNFELSGKDRNILGMVGSGYMEGKMILSKQALKNGFNNNTDKKNTAIHEFVHLIDKADGVIDGIPELLLDKTYILPWVDLMEKKMLDIEKGKSDINEYGATSHAEFLSVVSEYFFEHPELLERKHPKLYAKLNRIFKGKTYFK